MQYVLRTPLARVLHTMTFELFVVVLLSPVISLLADNPSNITSGLILVTYFGVLVLNYIYNFAFDQLLLRLRKPVYERGIGLRIAHALFFNAVLMLFALPAAMLMANFSFEEALKLGLDAAPFVLVITIFYNKGFDWCLE